MMPRKIAAARHGAVGIIYLVGITMILGIVGAGVLMAAEARYARGMRMRANLALEQMAAGSLARGRAELARSADYAGADRLPLGLGEVSIRIERTGGRPTAIVATAAVPTLAQPTHSLTRRTAWPAAQPAE